jgi:hypothetical protein
MQFIAYAIDTCTGERIQTCPPKGKREAQGIDKRKPEQEEFREMTDWRNIDCFPKERCCSNDKGITYD